MRKIILLVLVAVVLAPAISPASVIVPAGAPEGSTVGMEWGTYEDGVWASKGDCSAEGEVEITILDDKTVYFSCDVEGLESVSFRLYSIESNGERRFMQQANQMLYRNGDNICDYNYGESCLYSKDCGCPDGYFCYLDGPYGSYSYEKMREEAAVLGFDVDIDNALRGCIHNSLEGVYGSAGSGEQGDCIGQCGCDQCGKHLFFDDCESWERCTDAGVFSEWCRADSSCLQETRETDSGKNEFNVVFVQLSGPYDDLTEKIGMCKDSWEEEFPDMHNNWILAERFCKLENFDESYQSPGAIVDAFMEASSDCAVESGYDDFDRVVGIVDMLELPDEKGNIIIEGVSARYFPVVILPHNQIRDTTNLMHELGHTFGLCDEGYGVSLKPECASETGSELCDCKDPVVCDCESECECCPNAPEEESIMCSEDLCGHGCTFGEHFTPTSLDYMRKEMRYNGYI